MTADPDRWPELPYAAWQDTAATLQLWTQIVGKVRLALTPWLNHSWHVTLYVTARGLTTGPIPDGGAPFQIDFDFIDHVLWLRTSDGHFRQLMLKPTPVAEFYADVMIALERTRHRGQDQHHAVRDRRRIPFDQDTTHASYDADYAQPVLARAGVGARRDGAFPHRLSRQSRARCISSGARSIWR